MAVTSLVRLRAESFQICDDFVANEEPLEIILRSAQDTTMLPLSAGLTLRSPGQDKDLALGYLFTEGLIKYLHEVIEVQTQSRQCLGKADTITVTLRKLDDEIGSKLIRRTVVSAACGACGKASAAQLFTHPQIRWQTQLPQVDSSKINNWPNTLQLNQKEFGTTGGLHAAGLFDQENNLTHWAEDIGRHNALDKVIGAAFQEGLIPLHSFSVLLSGRSGFELIQKSQMAEIPVVASIGAPSSLAVEMAQNAGQTLIGFLKKQSLNVYSGNQRITQLKRSGG